MNSFVTAFKELAKNLNIKYKDINLYFQAFTHKSYSNEHKVPCNERLEFIGDAILDFLVGEFMFETYPDMPEGELSKKRAAFVCEEANKNYSLKLGLDKLILLGKGLEKEGGRTRPAVLGDLFEAFLGALYLDNKKLSEVRKILRMVVFPNIIGEAAYLKDYKSELQEQIQAENRKSVNYVLENEVGPSHDKTFTISVYFENVKLGEGVGKTHKEAEQLAAKQALDKLAK